MMFLMILRHVSGQEYLGTCHDGGMANPVALRRASLNTWSSSSLFTHCPYFAQRMQELRLVRNVYISYSFL